MINTKTTDTDKVKWKLQICKLELHKMHIKKSGKNTFNHYNYYELEDILPPITNIFVQNKLCSTNYTKDNKMYLEILDFESKQSITFDVKIKEYPQDTKKNKDYGTYMKIQQGLQTYARRSLWLLALDIVEPNDIEAIQPATPEPKNKSKSRDNTEQKANTNHEITQEKIKQILDAAYEKVTDANLEFNIDNAAFTIKRLCNDEKLYNACIATLESKPANILMEE